jgi:hypothetical protein
VILGLTIVVRDQDKGSAASVPATDSKAAVTGTVSDQNCADVAGAVVTVDNGAGFTQNSTTDGQGLYAVMDLPAGSYTISVVVSGARIFQANVVLSPGQLLTLGVAGAPVAQPASSQPTTGATAPSAPVAPLAVPNAPTAAAPAPTAAPSPAPVTAQAGAAANGGTGPASIGGVVNDQTGAVVVGATITITSSAGAVKTAISDDKGAYLIIGLPPGSYTVAGIATGFKKFEVANVALVPGQNLALDLGLEPAGTTTEVNVEGQRVAQVETESAQVSGTITEKEVHTLALNGRNFTQLIALAPGVSNQTGQDEAKVGVTGSVKYSVNGGRVEYNTFEVDGSDVLNAGLNGAQSTLVVYPSLDSIQEVKVLTSNYGAMYGRTASGTVIVTTKSGGAQWHGDGYGFLRNEAFNARNYFDQTKSAPKYRRYDFGYTIGGPLSIPNFYNPNKDKTFIFWSQEFRIEDSPSDLQPNFNRGVPSLAERSGDFSDVCPPSTGSLLVVFPRAQYPDCPSSGTTSGLQNAFPNNKIAGPGSGALLDSNALAILNTNLIPLPNSNTGCNSSIGSCYNAVISVPTHWREELLRVDHSITPKLRATFRYIHDSWDTVTPVPQWGFVQNSFPTVQNKLDGPGISMVAQLTHTITPTLLNEFTASYINSHITLNNQNGPGGANYQRPAALGTPGGLCTPSPSEIANGVGNAGCMGAIFNNGFGGKVPGIVIGGTNQEYGGNGFTADPSYMPWEHTNPTYSYRDDVSKSLGKHTLQFGAQLIFSQRNQINSAIGAASGNLQGLLTFSNLNGGNHNTGNAFANFLTLLTPNPAASFNSIQSYTQDSAQLRYYQRYRIGEPYIQDDWRVNSRLTLNLGVRFSLFGVFHEKYLTAYNWDPSAYSATLASQLSVNAVTGQLVNGPGGNGSPIPLNLSSLDPRITNGIVQCGINHVPAGCMTGKVFNPAPRVGFAWDPRGDGKTSIRSGYGIFFEHGTGQEANTGSLEASAPLVLSVTQRFPGNYGCIGGGTSCPAIGGALPGAFPIDVTAIPTHAVWSYAQQWSLSLQRQLPKFLVAIIG